MGEQTRVMDPHPAPYVIDPREGAADSTTLHLPYPVEMTAGDP